MVAIHDWEDHRRARVRMLEKQTGRTLDSWMAEIRSLEFSSKAELRRWLEQQGVHGYPRSLLEMEQFGYPDFFRVDGQQLIDAQFERNELGRLVYDRLVQRMVDLGDSRVEARKSYVSLVGPKRTFARIQVTNNAVNVGLRLKPGFQHARLKPCKLHPTMPTMISIASAEELDEVALDLFDRAYRDNLR